MPPSGFQGGLNDYRIASTLFPDTGAFQGAALGVPSCFIAGDRDVGVVQRPGARAKMESAPGFLGTFLVAGAGHWVQQEQPEAVVAHLLAFLSSAKSRKRSMGNGSL
jgi:pimeloyl-ACP methyl ester carboxylesterase